MVWQDFSTENLEIRASSFADGEWAATTTVSESSASDWSPSIAPVPDSSVWVAWDSYDSGNYDVLLRSIRADRIEPVI